VELRSCTDGGEDALARRDAAQLFDRHKSGVAMRLPRIARIRADKPAAEADRLESLMALVENQPANAVVD
jgi:DNA ligase-1